MPKRAAESDSPPAKRAKQTPSTFKSAREAHAETATANTDENGDRFWPLSSKGTKRVTVSQFKGTWMVNVREYYEDKADGTMKPGKKGIALQMEQFAALVEALPGIEAVLRGAGVSVPRPAYDNDGDDFESVKDEVMDEEAACDDEKGKRKNHEATSDEDDDE